MEYTEYTESTLKRLKSWYTDFKNSNNNFYFCVLKLGTIL